VVACACKFAIDFWCIGMWYPIAWLKQDRRRILSGGALKNHIDGEGIHP